MKHTHLFVALLLAGAAGMSTGFASPYAARAASQKPVPIKIVHPTGIPREYENATVELTMTIDESGVPHNVEPSGRLPAQVSERLCSAVTQWRFSPCYVDGRATRTRVLLPLHLVDGYRD